MDVDFVRKAVRAIGRCAIKVEVGGDHTIIRCLLVIFAYEKLMTHSAGGSIKILYLSESIDFLKVKVLNAEIYHL